MKNFKINGKWKILKSTENETFKYQRKMENLKNNGKCNI